MRLLPVLLAVGLLVVGCSDAPPDEVSEVQTRNGLLDCPSDLVQYSVTDLDVDALGSPTPDAALALLTPDLGLPTGVASVESEDVDDVVFVFTDSEGHRRGRVVVSRPGSGGWFVMATERCG